MGVVAAQITSFMIVYSTVYSDANQRKHQSSTSLAFVPDEFSAQMAINAENVSMLWRHHVKRTQLHILAIVEGLDISDIFSINDIAKYNAIGVRIQYIPRNLHTVFALLCFVVVIHWLIFPYPSGLLHWHCGNLTIAPVPAKQPWWIWINTSFEFIMNDCITTTKQTTTKPCAYFLGYTVCGCWPNTNCLQIIWFFGERIFCNVIPEKSFAICYGKSGRNPMCSSCLGEERIR